MPTRRGTVMLGGAVVMGVTGRVLGLTELYVLAVAGALALVAAVVYVHSVPFALACRRRVHPSQVEAGALCRVELELSNRSLRQTPGVVALEPVGSAGSAAHLVVPSLAPGGSGRAAYEVPTERRGRYQLGPLRLTLEDPFGLAATSAEAAPATSVLVYPAVEPLTGVPAAAAQDPSSRSARHGGRAHGEDFFALRPYEVGDDLRRVHWPSTARADELMIRQVELPWQRRVTVLLDVRRAVHDADSLERAVSAAASILTGSHRDGAVTRLLTTTGSDTGFGASRGHWESAMAALATIGPGRNHSLAALISHQARHGVDSSLALVTTDAAGAADIRAAVRLRARVGLVVLVLVRTAAGPAGLAAALPSSSGLRVLVVSPERTLAAGWNADPVLSGNRPRGFSAARASGATGSRPAERGPA